MANGEYGGLPDALRSPRTLPAVVRHVPVAAIFALGSLVLYGMTAAPSVATVFDDSLEFQVVLLGIALYLLLRREA